MALLILNNHLECWLWISTSPRTKWVWEWSHKFTRAYLAKSVLCASIVRSSRYSSLRFYYICTRFVGDLHEILHRHPLPLPPKICWLQLLDYVCFRFILLLLQTQKILRNSRKTNQTQFTSQRLNGGRFYLSPKWTQYQFSKATGGTSPLNTINPNQTVIKSLFLRSRLPRALRVIADKTLFNWFACASTFISI